MALDLYQQAMYGVYAPRVSHLAVSRGIIG